MGNLHGSFVWYELMTPDPGAAKTFYDAVVGWDIEPHPAGEMDYRMIRRADGGNAGGLLRLSDEMAEHGARPGWFGYLGVDDVDRTVAGAEGDGAKVLMGAHDIGGVGRLALLADPSGAPFYLMRGASDESSDVFSADRPQHVRWNELASADPDSAIAFYTRHFGWSQEGAMDMGPMGSYRFVQHGGVAIGAVMPKPDPMPVSLWTFYFGVPDIDRAAEAVSAHGGAIIQPPIEIPGGEYSLVAVDFQGASFGLVGPRIGARA